MLHDVPDSFFGHPVFPCSADLIDPAKQFPSINTSRAQPFFKLAFHPIRYGNGSHVPRFANQIEHRYVDNRPLSEEIRAANETLANRIVGALQRDGKGRREEPAFAAGR